MNSALQVTLGGQNPGCTDTEVWRNCNTDGVFAAVLEMLSKGILNKEILNKEILNKEILNKEILNKEILNKEIHVADPDMGTNSISPVKQKYDPAADFAGMQSIFINKRVQLSGQASDGLLKNPTNDIADQEEIKELPADITEYTDSTEARDYREYRDYTDITECIAWTAGFTPAASNNATTSATGQIEQAKSPPDKILFEPVRTPETISPEYEKNKADTGGSSKNSLLEQSNIVKITSSGVSDPVIQTRNPTAKKISLADEGNGADKIYPDKPEMSHENFKETKMNTSFAGQRVVIEPIINQSDGKQSDISQKSIELSIQRVSDELPKIVKHECQKINGRESSHGLIVQLEPKELGKMLVKLIKHDGVVSVKILVEQQDSKTLLENSLSGLKQGLSEQGVKYGRIDVEMGSQFTGQNNRQSPNWFREQSAQRGYSLEETQYCVDDYEGVRAVGRAGTNSGVDYLA